MRAPMHIQFGFVVLIIGMLPAAGAVERIKGNVYFLGISLDQEGIAGGWSQIGPAGEWQQTIAGTVLQGKLYTVEGNGGLYATDLSSGTWKQLGSSEFATTQFLFTAANDLYSIESSGSLYHINPENGQWQQIGAAGDWNAAIAAVTLKGNLYTVHQAGGLFETNLQTGQWRQLGQPEFGDTAFLFAIGNTLFTIEHNGSLYCVNPADGGYAQIGKTGAWKGALAATSLNGLIYTTEKNGSLVCTKPASGKRTGVGKAEFATTRFMFPSAGLLYTIEDSGSLYRVEAKNGLAIDEFDWCPTEVERLFRDQGKGLSQGLQTKKIMGAKATHRAMLDGFAWLANQTHPDDLAVIYVGAHGFTDPNEGWGIVTADLKTLWGHELKASLAPMRGRVLVFVETCTCGAFAAAHAHDPPVPPNVTAFCACAANEITDNPLDMALAEALYGRADFNHDGVVDIDELARYVELRYKEWWPTPGEGTNTPVIVRGKNMPGTLALTHAAKSLSAMAVNDNFLSVLDEGEKGNLFNVHVLGWSSEPGRPYYVANTATRDQLCLPADGPPLLVEQGGTWKPARLTKADGKTYQIRYLGSPGSDDTVTAARIRYPFGGKR